MVFLIACAVALLIALASAARPERRAGLWLALAIVGQAASLQLINAGPRVGYQHYLPWTQLTSPQHAGFALMVAIQSGLVALGVRRYTREARAILRPWKAWQLLLILLVFVLSSATLSRNPAGYASELVLASFVQLVGLLNIALACAAVPSQTIGRMHDWWTRHTNDSAPIDPFALAAACFVVIAAGLLSYFSYQRHPHVPDEVVYLLHARYFAKGMLYLPAPPVPGAFDVDLMYFDPHRWFSPVPPGWPAMLSVGVLLGVPWLVNPVLAGLNVLLAYHFVRELYDRRTARVAALLLAVSPWHVFMAMNFMTHTFTLFCALVAANAVVELRQTGRLRWAWLGGIGIGLVSLNRPLEGLGVALLLGVWTLGIREKQLRFAPTACLALGAMAVGALTMPYNKLLTGSATRFPIMMYTDRYYGAGTNALGFGANRGLGWPGLDPFPGHGPLDVLVNANMNIFSLNVELLGWAAGSLLMLLVLLCSGRLRRADYYMVAALAVIVGLHSFYWFSGGPDFGARYWYLILVPCIALTVRGAAELATVLNQSGITRHASARVGLVLATASIVTLTTFFPWRATDKYWHYRGMRPDVRQLMQSHDFTNSIILVRGKRHPDYASAAIYNPLDLRSRAPIFAWDRGNDVRQQLLRAYPGRRFWVVDGPTLTGSGFRIAGGPYNPSELNK